MTNLVPTRQRQGANLHSTRCRIAFHRHATTASLRPGLTWLLRPSGGIRARLGTSAVVRRRPHSSGARGDLIEQLAQVPRSHYPGE
jgi:hypothetical protein